MKPHYPFFIMMLLCASFVCSPAAMAQPEKPPPASNVQVDKRSTGNIFAEEMMAAQTFIESINESRKDLSMKQYGMAKSRIIMARSLIPIIAKATQSQRRLTRVEFGGGLYADDLGQRKNYKPIETQSLENFTRPAGPRWVKTTRTESDAQIIYITLNLADEKARNYLDEAEKHIDSGDIKAAQMLLEELSDQVIRVGGDIPAAVQVRDYMILADNYILVGNFFGARSSLRKANMYLDQMKNEETYKNYYSDIVTLHKNIADLQDAFAKMDADQIKNAEINLKKWREQVTVWVSE